MESLYSGPAARKDSVDMRDPMMRHIVDWDLGLEKFGYVRDQVMFSKAPAPAPCTLHPAPAPAPVKLSPHYLYLFSAGADICFGN